MPAEKGIVEFGLLRPESNMVLVDRVNLKTGEVEKFEVPRSEFFTLEGSTEQSSETQPSPPSEEK